MYFDLAVFGGGASGYFSAIIAASTFPNKSVAIFEKSNKTLAKVKVSGGGRCNVTHACFEQKELVKFYPRGQKELLGPFHQFMTFDAISWFEEHGVTLKTEDDGRMFPVTDSSQTIIDCLSTEISKNKVQIFQQSGLKNFTFKDNQFIIELDNLQTVTATKIILCTGSSEKIWEMLSTHHIPIIKPVPSLFTFNVKNKLFNDLMGLSIPNAQLSIEGFPMEIQGPLLFTHWGLSGPAVLKLSAFAANYLYDNNYQFKVNVNFIGEDEEFTFNELKKIQQNEGYKSIKQINPFQLPKRLLEVLHQPLSYSDKKLAEIKKDELKQYAKLLTQFAFQASGKTTFKDEFVTCGGVDLNSVNMKTMESKVQAGLFFAGECLNIDGVTGGFNFQAAWTTGYLAGKNCFVN